MQLEQITDVRSPAATPGVQRLPSLKALTSIRFFAALHVALYHLTSADLWGPLSPTMSVGYIGVSFFFILSGFILTYSHAREYERGKGVPTKFWVARFARIYPLYLMSMIFAGYVNRSQFHQRIHILAYIADLFMVQSWSTRMVNFFNVPAWTVANEAFFYLLFPFILLRLKPSSAKKSLLTLILLYGAALALPLLCVHFYPAFSWHENAPRTDTTATLMVFRVRRLPIFALPQFLAGVSLGWFFLRYRPSVRVSQWLAVAGLVLSMTIFALSNYVPVVLLSNGFLIPAFSMLILGLSEENWLSRLLSIPPLVLLGEASFALYLTHFLFNDWVKGQFHAGSTLLDAVWKLAIIIPLSILLHLAVERPCRRLILRLWSRRHPAQLTVV